MRRAATTRIAVSIAAALALGGTAMGCAATTYDESLVDTTVDAASTTSTVAVAGSASELLPELVAEAQGLAARITGEGGAGPAADRIAALWSAAEQEVASTRPELLGDFDANVARCQRAVELRRAADADKAASNLSQLVSAYLAE